MDNGLNNTAKPVVELYLNQPYFMMDDKRMEKVLSNKNIHISKLFEERKEAFMTSKSVFLPTQQELLDGLNSKNRHTRNICQLRQYEWLSKIEEKYIKKQILLK